MNISLPDSLRAFVEELVKKGGFSSASEYVRELLLGAQRQAEVESKLIAAVERGGRIELSSRYWATKDKRISAILRRAKNN